MRSDILPYIRCEMHYTAQCSELRYELLFNYQLGGKIGEQIYENSRRTG